MIKFNDKRSQPDIVFGKDLKGGEFALFGGSLIYKINKEHYEIIATKNEPSFTTDRWTGSCLDDAELQRVRVEINVIG